MAVLIKIHFAFTGLFSWGLKWDVLFCLQVHGPMTGVGGGGGRGVRVGRGISGSYLTLLNVR